MKRTLIFISLLLFCSVQAITLDGREKKETVVLGSGLDRDTTRKSGRSLNSYEIAPKGEWQVGMSVAYFNLSTDNSEFMLLLNDAGMEASVFRIAPHASYTYMSNQSAGLRFQYTNARCNVDAATLDLLGNFSFDVKDVRARMMSYGGHVYNRSYLGLDRRGRVGLFLDFDLGFTRSKSVVAADAYTVTRKVGASVSPGLIYFPMNNVSVFAALSLADISYNWAKGYSGGQVTGTKNSFAAKAGLNLMNLNFGLSIHL